MKINEGTVEQTALEILQELGWTYASSQALSPDGDARERATFGDVVLLPRLRRALAGLNPHMPAEALDDALKQLTRSEAPSLIEENRRLHALITDGVDVVYRDEDGTIRGDKARVFDFYDPSANDLLVSNQFTVVENGKNKRPDVVAFVNGLPVVVLELKSAAAKQTDLHAAYNQLQTYKADIPSLFRTNAALIISDGLFARIGSLSAGVDRFMPWRTITGAQDDFTPDGPQEFGTLMRGVFQPRVLLDLMKNFTVFLDKGDGPFKIIAGYHQYHGARKVLVKAIAATREQGDRKAGVIWHTQGSGKSFLMAFVAGLMVREPALENPTLIVLTDRNDLDDQLFSTFSGCQALLRQTPQHIESREDLRETLDRQAGGLIFTTLQKFAPERGEEDYPMLSDRTNILVLADEAHRSQYGLRAKINPKDGTRRYGYARYLRQALPNASFAGFTGTPIEAGDVNTPAMFGDYVDIYDISRAVEDKATVPIYYESRLVRVELDQEKLPEIDEQIDDLFDDESIADQERTKASWTGVERLIGAPPRLEMMAKDVVEHFERRASVIVGKGMVVCMSRRICVDLYNRIIQLRPDWHSDEDTDGEIKIVMTGASADPREWQQHIGTTRRRDLLAKRARDPEDPLKIVLVRDMWLTGFDAPCLHTLYIDKPMRGHGLMQAIARVNRVFRDKPGGLVVDYIGIGQNLRKALANYTPSDRERTGIDAEDADSALRECIETVRDFFDGHDYSLGVHGTAQERLHALANAMEWVLQVQKQRADKETDEKKKREAHSYFDGLIARLSKAFGLAAASDYAREVGDEVGFLQAVKAALAKPTLKGKISQREREFAVGQMIASLIEKAEIVDILAAAGLESPEISVLSEEFLASLQNMGQKNLALKALKKLLNSEISSRETRNVVEAKAFSDRLKEAVARYHAGTITTLEMIQQLIDMARDLKASIERGEELGLNDDELAFYDALAKNKTAVDVMGIAELALIASELVEKLQRNVTVDWHKRESARAKMRILVRAILKKHGYPPSLAPEAISTVISQAETLLKSG